MGSIWSGRRHHYSLRYSNDVTRVTDHDGRQEVSAPVYSLEPFHAPPLLRIRQILHGRLHSLTAPLAEVNITIACRSDEIDGERLHQMRLLSIALRKYSHRR